MGPLPPKFNPGSATDQNVVKMAQIPGVLRALGHFNDGFYSTSLVPDELPPNIKGTIVIILIIRVQ